MSFEVHDDSWLGEMMGCAAFRVDGSGDTTKVAWHVTTTTAPTFHFAKVPTDRVDDVTALARLGFSVVDTNVTFELTREIEVPVKADVGDIRDGEAEAVLDIAGTAFRYSRFHLDPQVGMDVAHKIKREWIGNYVLRKRGDLLIVAREKGRVVGFLAPLVSHGTAVIDLVAVASDAQGRGAGRALTAAFAQRYKGMPRIVGTQVANVPSIRLYTKLGFQLQKSAYVMHLHR